MNQATLERDFRAGFAVFLDPENDNTQQLLDFCSDDGTFVCDDVPFPLDKDGFADHLAFHWDGLWDKRQWCPQPLKFMVNGEQGLVAGSYNDRGKPRDSGFRQRPGFCTVVCAWDKDTSKWVALNIHMSPLLSQILDASPG